MKDHSGLIYNKTLTQCIGKFKHKLNNMELMEAVRKQKGPEYEHFGLESVYWYKDGKDWGVNFHLRTPCDMIIYGAMPLIDLNYSILDRIYVAW